MSFSLVKISASGNRFIIADMRNTRQFENHNIKNHSFLVEEDILKKIVQSSISERKAQLNFLQSQLKQDHKFDGLCILNSSTEYDFVCDFYNRDGSQAELCGNATSCLAFYEDELNKKSSLYFKFSEERIKSFKKDNCYWTAFKKFQKPQRKTAIFKDKEVSYFFIRTGVPHGVLEWKASLEPEKLRSLAEYLRHEGDMNVSFYQNPKSHSVKALSYERGVEEFTLSCGTGALAIALTLQHRKPEESLKKVAIEMPGGELIIQLEPELALSSSVKFGY